MTLNKLFAKLRGHNKGQYVMLTFCVFLSVLLVSAYALMYFGPTVQEFLPEGGDTRKLANLLLGVTILGCTFFTVYASGLFFRYKSREYGIFLAMGTPRTLLNGLIYRELSFVLLTGSISGLIFSVPASFGLWKVFELFIISTKEMQYRFGIAGLLFGIVFCCFLTFILFWCGRSFVRKSNVMDILKTGNKTEVGKPIPAYTFRLGIILILAGIFIGSIIPSICVQLFRLRLPAIFSFTYLIAVYGVYLVLLSAVAGRGTKRNYNNLVSTSLTRFTAKAATRNMCVVTLLLFANLFSAFYGMIYYDSAGLMSQSENKRDATFHYPLSASTSPLQSDDIYTLADQYHITIEDLTETTAANLVISYKYRDLNDSGKYFEVNETDESSTLFFSETAFQKLTGRQIAVTPGTYKTITPTDYQETIFTFIDGLKEIYNPDSDMRKKLSFDGTVEFDTLTSMGSTFSYVLSDNDYALMTASLNPAYQETFLSFDIKKSDVSYTFLQALTNLYISNAGTAEKYMAYPQYYDPWAAALAEENSESYSYDYPIDISADNNTLSGDWRYAPVIPIIQAQDSLKLIGVYVMLCLYIFLITLAAISTMCYVRSISIAADNKDVFGNLKKLGADTAYNRSILKKQLRKVYQYPAVVGSFLAFIFSLSIAVTNDGRLTIQEVKLLIVLVALIALIGGILTLVYAQSKKKAEIIADIC